MLLTSHTIHNETQALIFMTECTLATVDHLAGLSRTSKSELRRQISIAQIGVDWCRSAGVPQDIRGVGRLQKIIDDGITVEQWANRHNQPKDEPGPGF